MPLVIGGETLFASGKYATVGKTVTSLPVSSKSAAWLKTYPTVLHANFGYAAGTGMPWNVVPASQELVPVTFGLYKSESDPGPYPMPDPAVCVFEGPNGGNDHHCLVYQEGGMLYELGHCYWTQSGGWTAIVGAKFNTVTGAARKVGITSASASGMPILPGVIGYDEVAAGVVAHACNIVIPEPTYYGWISPASHWNDEYKNVAYMPMGARLRLKPGSYGLTGQAAVIATALQEYGAIVTDVGPGGFQLEGETNAGWIGKDLAQLNEIPVSAFDVVETGKVVNGW